MDMVNAKNYYQHRNTSKKEEKPHQINSIAFHETDDSNELVELSLQFLKDQGFKMTQKRREILEIFAQERKYLSAKTIHQAMAKKYPTMSYNTTYRNLYDFVEQGILESTEFNHEQYFMLNCGTNHHHHHFICTSCGNTLPIDACPMDQVDTDLSRVRIESHRFEIFGKCEDCLAKRN